VHHLNDATDKKHVIMGIDKPAAIVFIAISVFVFCACMKNYGRFSMDHRVAQDFRGGVVRPDLRYYYAGRPNMPYAIIGIDRAYTLSSKIWISVAPDADQLRKMSRNIYEKAQKKPFGAYIVSPDERTIGIWYSNIITFSVREDPQNRTIEVLFVNPEINDRPGW
jgi:hypothetical protein